MDQPPRTHEIEPELTPEQIKPAAKLELQYVLHARTRVYEDAAVMNRWLLASLLAINGAGAAAVLSAVRHETFTIASCALFVVGIVLAMVAGARTVRHHMAAHKALGPIAGYWHSVSEDGVRVTSIEAEHHKEGERISAAETTTYLIGLVSLGCFIFGCVVAGLGLV